MFSNSSESASKKALTIFSLCLWTLGGFFAAQYIVLFILQGLIASRVVQFTGDNQTLVTAVVLALAFIFALGIVLGLPRLLKVDKTTPVELGVSKPPRFKDIGLSLLGYGGYFLLTYGLTVIVQNLWTGFNVDQAQEIGFKDLANSFEYVLAFVVLVIIPPIVEEILFRGYLFGKIRKRASFWLTAFIVSTAFGIVHQQLNVGLDVFALSLVLCFLREKTGAVWAGMLLHMIKNAIAFVILFLHPEILELILKG